MHYSRRGPSSCTPLATGAPSTAPGTTSLAADRLAGGTVAGGGLDHAANGAALLSATASLLAALGPHRTTRSDRGDHARVGAGGCQHRPAPASGGPLENHKAQVAVYCLLVEEHFQQTVPHGIVQYQDRSLLVPFDASCRAWIWGIVQQLRAIKGQGLIPGRSHQQAGRCRSCSYRPSCTQALR